MESGKGGCKDNYFFKYNLSIRQPHTQEASLSEVQPEASVLL